MRDEHLRESQNLWNIRNIIFSEKYYYTKETIYGSFRYSNRKNIENWNIDKQFITNVYNILTRIYRNISWERYLLT